VDARIKKVPPKIGYYLAGFTDGEGSFNVSFRPRKDYPVPWKISLSFNVSQKDRVILALFKRHLGCGTLRGRPDGVWYYETTNLTALTENVIPFFERFPFLSANVVRKDTGRTLFAPYAIRKIDGVKVGFIGMTLEGTPLIVSPSGISNLEFLDEADTANRYAKELHRQGVDAGLTRSNTPEVATDGPQPLRPGLIACQRWRSS